MALQISYTAPSGIIVPTAYAHIASWQGNKTSINVQLIIWKDLASKNAKLQPVGYLGSKLDLADGATMTQMYTALKLQPIFANATDV